MFRSDVSLPSDIAIILIDEASLYAMDPIAGRWPWPRQILAEAIVNLKDSNARVVGLDIMLGDGGYNSEEDLALARALDYAGNVILPEKRDVRSSGAFDIDYFDMPLPDFKESALTTGYINLLGSEHNFS